MPVPDVSEKAGMAAWFKGWLKAFVLKLYLNGKHLWLLLLLLSRSYVYCGDLRGWWSLMHWAPQSLPSHSVLFLPEPAMPQHQHHHRKHWGSRRPQGTQEVLRASVVLIAVGLERRGRGSRETEVAELTEVYLLNCVWAWGRTSTCALTVPCGTLSSLCITCDSWSIRVI